MKKFISIILSIGLFVCIPITVLLFCTNIYLQGNSIQKQINKIDKEKFQEDIKEMMPDLGNIEAKEETEAFLYSEFMQEATAIGMKNALNYIRTGKGDTILSKKEYEYLVDKHVDDIVKEVNENATTEEKNEVKKVLKDSYEEIMETVPRLSIMNEDEDLKTLQIIRDICDPALRYTALGITVTLSLLLIWIQRKRFNFIIYLVVPTLLNGILFIVSSSLLNMGIREIMKTEDKQYITEAIFKGFSNIVQTAGIILTVLSILSIIFLIVMRKKENKTEQKA